MTHDSSAQTGTGLNAVATRATPTRVATGGAVDPVPRTWLSMDGNTERTTRAVGRGHDG